MLSSRLLPKPSTEWSVIVSLFAIGLSFMFSNGITNLGLGYLVFVVILAVAKRKIAAIDRTIDVLKRKNVWSLISSILVLGAWAYIGINIPTMMSQHILIASGPFGHWLSVIALVGVFTIWGIDDWLRGFAVVSFVYAFHEIAWVISEQVTYRFGSVTITPPNSSVSFHLQSFWPYLTPFFFTMVLLFYSYFLSWRTMPLWKEKAIVIAVTLYSIGWIVIGFPITSDPEVFPQFVNNVGVNLLESFSWIVPCVVALLPDDLFPSSNHGLSAQE